MSDKDFRKLEKAMDEFMNSSRISDARTQKDVDYIKKEIGEIKQLVSDHYVTRIEFDPIKKIVYGLVGLILTSVFVGILSLVM